MAHGAGAGQGAFALGEDLADPPDRGRDRTAPGLGGVRGEDGVKAKRIDALGRGIAANLAGERGDRLRDRVFLRQDPSVALAQHADAVVFLGEVDEVEVAGEGAGDLVGAGDRERFDERLRLVERARPAVECTDRERAQLLDVGEQVAAALFGQHSAEQIAEEADIGAKFGRQLAPGLGAPFNRANHTGRKTEVLFVRRAGLCRN